MHQTINTYMLSLLQMQPPQPIINSLFKRAKDLNVLWVQYTVGVLFHFATFVWHIQDGHHKMRWLCLLPHVLSKVENTTRLQMQWNSAYTPQSLNVGSQGCKVEHVDSNEAQSGRVFQEWTTIFANNPNNKKTSKILGYAPKDFWLWFSSTDGSYFAQQDHHPPKTKCWVLLSRVGN